MSFFSIRSNISYISTTKVPSSGPKNVPVNSKQCLPLEVYYMLIWGGKLRCYHPLFYFQWVYLVKEQKKKKPTEHTHLSERSKIN